MAGAIAPLSDFSTWARGNLLVIVLLILGAILLTRLANWARGQIMRRIDARAADTEELDQPSVMGVERIEVDVFSLRIVARTLPGMQFDVGRVIRARVARAFRSEGIIVSAELDTGHATGNAS